MTKITRKTIAIIVVLTFVLAAFITIAWGSEGFTNWKVSTWFSSNTKKTEKKKDTEEDDKLKVNDLIAEVENSETVSLKVVPYASTNAIAAADGIKITATVTPEDASIKTVNFFIDWTNPESSWATGKSVGDYVDMSVAGMTATLVGKQAFGEQITVTCESTFDDSKMATCTVDYAQRLNQLLLRFMHEGENISKGGQNITNTVTGKADTLINVGSEYRLGISPYYGTGTVSDEVTYKIEITASDLFVSTYCGGKVPGSYTLTSSDPTDVMINESFLKQVYGTAYVSKSTFYQKCSSGSIIGSGAMKVTYSVTGKYSTLTGTINLGFNLTTLGTAVGGVELAPGNVVM
ncbi:MAG: hypothetical protein J1G38_04525 [Clostridiales bacterium]|nr:hypothetical protein [Clostridiales bacterium]